MSHLSKIKTRLFDLEILKKTIEDLGFKYKSGERYQDSHNNCYDVDLAVFANKQSNEPLLGFLYNNIDQEYSLVTDIYFWKLDITLDSFIENLNQSYALNVVMKQAIADGFQSIKRLNQNDGTIQLIVQKWHS